MRCFVWERWGEGEGVLWRQVLEMEASGDRGARAPRSYQGGKRCWPLGGVIHSRTNEHVNKSSVRTLESLPLHWLVSSSLGQAPHLTPHPHHPTTPYPSAANPPLQSPHTGSPVMARALSSLHFLSHPCHDKMWQIGERREDENWVFRVSMISPFFSFLPLSLFSSSSSSDVLLVCDIAHIFTC